MTILQAYVGKLPKDNLDFRVIGYDKQLSEADQDVLHDLAVRHRHDVLASKINSSLTFAAARAHVAMLPGFVAGKWRVFYKCFPVEDASGRDSSFIHFLLLGEQHWEYVHCDPAFLFKNSLFVGEPTKRLKNITLSQSRLSYDDLKTRFSAYNKLIRSFSPKDQQLVHAVARQFATAHNPVLRVHSETANGFKLAHGILLLLDDHTLKSDQLSFVALDRQEPECPACVFGHVSPSVTEPIAQLLTEQPAVMVKDAEQPVQRRQLEKYNDFCDFLQHEVKAAFPRRGRSKAAEPELQGGAALLEKVLEQPMEFLSIGASGAGKTSYILSVSHFASLYLSGVKDVTRNWLVDLKKKFNEKGHTPETVYGHDDSFIPLLFTHNIVTKQRSLRVKICFHDYMGGRIDNTKKGVKEFDELQANYDRVDGILYFVNSNWITGSAPTDKLNIYENFLQQLKDNKRSRQVPTALVLTHCDMTQTRFTGNRFVDRLLATATRLPWLTLSLLWEWPLVPVTLFLLLLALSDRIDLANFQPALFGGASLLFLISLARFFRPLPAGTSFPQVLARLLFLPVFKAREAAFVPRHKVLPMLEAKHGDVLGTIIDKNWPEHAIFPVALPTVPPEKEGSDYVPIDFALNQSKHVTDPLEHCLFWSIVRRLGDYATQHNVADHNVRQALQCLMHHFRHNRKEFNRRGCRSSAFLRRFHAAQVMNTIQDLRGKHDELRQEVHDWIASGQKMVDEIAGGTIFEEVDRDMQVHLNDDYTRLEPQCRLLPVLREDLAVGRNTILREYLNQRLNYAYLAALSRAITDLKEHGVTVGLKNELDRRLYDLCSTEIDWLVQLGKDVKLPEEWRRECRSKVDELAGVVKRPLVIGDTVDLADVACICCFLRELVPAQIIDDSQLGRYEHFEGELIRQYMTSRYSKEKIDKVIPTIDLEREARAGELAVVVRRGKGFFERLSVLFHDLGNDYFDASNTVRSFLQGMHGDNKIDRKMDSWHDLLSDTFATGIVPRIEEKLRSGRKIADCIESARLSGEDLSEDVKTQLLDLDAVLGELDGFRLQAVNESSSFSRLKDTLSKLRKQLDVERLDELTKNWLRSGWFRFRMWFLYNPRRVVTTIALLLILAILGLNVLSMVFLGKNMLGELLQLLNAV